MAEAPTGKTSVGASPSTVLVLDVVKGTPKIFQNAYAENFLKPPP